MRPRSLADFAGQDHLLEPGSPLRRLVESGEGRTAPASVVMWGPAGTGKTTLAYLVARGSDRVFVELSAVNAGVKDIREVVTAAKRRLAVGGRETVLFIDEVHRFSKSQQDALLPAVENRWVTLMAATTENPSFSVITPLLSRSLLATLRPLSDDALGLLLDRAVDSARGLAGSVRLDPAARAEIVRLAGGDARRAITILEAAAGGVLDGTEASSSPDGPPLVAAAAVARAVDKAAVQYDRDGDQHYDVISAFIKSVRGSDVDAAVHYLARMIAAGEDPRFIARRIVILASEDIGLADPQALPMAVAAAQVVQLVGLPEARLALAEAVVYLATAPKSNAAYLAIDAALEDIAGGRIGAVPAHLRDAHYGGAGRLGHGEGYRYAHDSPHAIAPQSHLPAELAGQRYYRPTDRGYEHAVSERLTKIRAILAQADPAARQ
jgi:putative ATPase